MAIEARPPVTPGSLAAQYNAESGGLDPTTWLYPYGNSC
jgi:hypothetical protein